MSRVLVVDDDDNVRALVCNILADDGLETDSACDSAEAVAMLKAHRPDLLLLDLHLRGVDGWGLIEHVRGTKDPPFIILFTGPDDSRSFARAVRAGVVGFLPKPLEFRTLVSTCRRVLETAGEQARSPERRSEERRPVLIGISVAASGEIPEALGELVNLSSGGAQMITIAPFEVGTRLRVALEPGVTGQDLEFDVEVRWCVPVPTGHAHGLSLVGLPARAEAQLREFLNAGS